MVEVVKYCGVGLEDVKDQIVNGLKDGSY